MSKQLPTVLVPDNGGARLPLGHAQEHNLVTEDVFIVEMRRLCDLRPLKQQMILRISGGLHLLPGVPLRRPVVAPGLRVGGEHLAVPGVGAQYRATISVIVVLNIQEKLLLS